MSLRPALFISAVSKELGSARQLVAHTLHFLGYEPIWQDVIGTEQGDLRAVLRKQIDECQGVVQLVGQAYGFEPRKVDEEFDRVSYTQYEALYARKRGKKVWYLLLDPTFPCDTYDAEPNEFRQFQTEYRQRVAHNAHLFHCVDTPDGLKAKVHELRGELSRLRHGFRLWATAVIISLAATFGLVTWLVVVERLRSSPDAVTEAAANGLFSAKDYAAAFHAYARLSDAAPGNIELHRQVEECARLGHLEKLLVERYFVLSQKQPGNAIYHNFLGNAFLSLDPGDKDGTARKEYQTAIQLDAKFASPLANLGILAFRGGKPEEAEVLFKQYLALEPNDAHAWVNLGLLYVGRVQIAPGDAKHVSAAEKSLRTAIQLDPASAPAHKALGRLYAATGKKTQALSAYQRSLALNYEQPEVRQQVELLALESGGARVAGSSGDDLQTRNVSGEAGNVPAVVAAMRLLEKRQFSSAERACQEWVKFEPNNPLAYQLLSRACEGAGRTAEARAARDQADRISNLPDSR